ncbi:hypothetical protein P8452_47068 [Trifolium repens]|nr:hypothetical protein P8452_47068 [Trifolium repens]
MPFATQSAIWAFFSERTLNEQDFRFWSSHSKSFQSHLRRYCRHLRSLSMWAFSSSPSIVPTLLKLQFELGSCSCWIIKVARNHLLLSVNSRIAREKLTEACRDDADLVQIPFYTAASISMLYSMCSPFVTPRTLTCSKFAISIEEMLQKHFTRISVLRGWCYLVF